MNSVIAAQIFPEHYPFRGMGALMNVAVIPREAMFYLINGSAPGCLVFYGRTQRFEGKLILLGADFTSVQVGVLF